MTTHALLREPMHLPPLDGMSCYTNVIAQIRWMLGLSNTQGLDAVREVDALTGRRSNELAEVTPQLLLLADEGCRIRCVDDFDLDEVRHDPLAFLRRRVGDHWTADHDDWFTPDQVAAYVERAERYADTLLRHPAVDFERRSPVFGDLVAAVEDGMLVPLLLMVDAEASHAVLVYGRHGNYFQVYDSARAPEGMLMTARQLESAMSYEALQAVAR